jgi:hypothetical protein
MEFPKVDFYSWFYKNCKRQRKNEAKICQVCPFREGIEEQEQKEAEIDMIHQNCEKCKDGYYEETSIHDDWDGVLHCVQCGYETKRYI